MRRLLSLLTGSDSRFSSLTSAAGGISISHLWNRIIFPVVLWGYSPPPPPVTNSPQLSLFLSQMDILFFCPYFLTPCCDCGGGCGGKVIPTLGSGDGRYCAN
ncbi:hypothetical protein GYMLUDRAFT_49533 [Collybiopsis luxurians FD-317 M1]|uniref:Uncharacterized protein n=1 Tax=Collybiopsis luxurians FD-317 M1 TaxID=944289 RepID=A0A0D0C5R8_9AGAR|nr:hypothetical protein GYMLUDRAFT_49533 [Collybiopsis luxurians FD-317 M1]